jgi:GNAT superfamily N-acetyltransferase
LEEEKPEVSLVSGHLSQREIKREMEERKSWEVRDGDEKDLDGILSLRKIVFGETERDRLDPAFWRWEFNNAPDGKAFIYIAEDADKIIGHFGDVPRRFSVQGEVFLGTLSLDLMVHPDYRRKGIFIALGRYGAERVRNERGLFMTAYPIRKQTIDGLKKIGWREVVELPVLVYPIRFQGIVNRYLHVAPLSFLVGGAIRFLYSLFFGWEKKEQIEKIKIEEVQQLDEEFDRFWQEAQSLSPIIGVRDRNFLTWRYLQNPTRNYTIYRAMGKGVMRGYIVLRKVDLLRFNSAVIVDLLALDKETLLALANKGIEFSRQEGINLLGFMVPKSHPYCRDLKRMGFLPSLKTFLFMVYPQREEKRLLRSDGWYVNWGDADVV